MTEPPPIFVYRQWVYPVVASVAGLYFGYFFKMPAFLIIPCVIAGTCALLLYDLIIASNYLRRIRARQLSDNAVDLVSIRQFLNAKVTRHWLLLTEGAFATVIAIGILVCGVIFYFPESRPKDGDSPYANAIIATLFIGGIVSGIISLVAFFDTVECDKVVNASIRESRQPACVQAIREIDDTKEFARADRSWFPCPMCKARIEMPFEMSVLTRIACPGCQEAFPFIALQAAGTEFKPDAEHIFLWAISFDPIPAIAYTNDWRIVCAGPNSAVEKFAELSLAAFIHSLPLPSGDKVDPQTCGTFSVEAFENVIDAYVRHHPYAGEPTCWYCNREEGVPERSVESHFNKVLSVTTGSTSTIKYNKASVRVSRCHDCAAAHNDWSPYYLSGALYIVMALAIIGTIVAFAFWRVISPVYTAIPNAAIAVLSLFGAVVLQGRGDTEYHRNLKRRGIKGELDVDLLPRCQVLRRDGFRGGARPCHRFYSGDYIDPSL